MGASNPKLLTMVSFCIFVCLASLLWSTAEGASLSSQNEPDFSFDQMGVSVDLTLKDKTNPLIGGKVHLELPVGEVWTTLEKGKAMLTPFVDITPLTDYLEQSLIGKMQDIEKVKADISYNAEKVFEGTINIAVDYTLVLKDGEEEKAFVTMQCREFSCSVH